jgi:methionine-gamma-lyase
MAGPGSLIAFELLGGIEAGRRLLETVRLPALAVSLGGVESLIQHPASMTHAAVRREDREAAGITDGLVRLAVGCEGREDLLADMQEALDDLL